MHDYLSNDTDGSQTAQVTRLLRDEATDNTPLLLELIEGGGCNRRLLGYLFGIGAFHTDRVVSAKAMQLLRRHAKKPDTITRAEKLREGTAYYYNETEYLSKLTGIEFDIFDFLLASRMVAWHRQQRVGARHESFYNIPHQTLNLSQYPENTLSDALGTLSFVRFITLPAHRQFDLSASMPALRQLPLESIYLENARLDLFPVDLFELPNLRTLSIKKGAYRQRHDMVVPDTVRSWGCATLEKLVIDGYSIAGEKLLGPFPALKQAEMVRCGLHYLDFLAQSAQLHELDLRNNQLAHLPAFLSGLTALRVLDLSHNPLLSIEIDLSQLVHLERFELKIQHK